MGDMVGRKWGIVASCLIFCLGVGLQLDTRWATFVVGRFIAGLGVVRRFKTSNMCDQNFFMLFLFLFLGSRVVFGPHVSIRGIYLFLKNDDVTTISSSDFS